MEIKRWKIIRVGKQNGFAHVTREPHAVLFQNTVKDYNTHQPVAYSFTMSMGKPEKNYRKQEKDQEFYIYIHKSHLSPSDFAILSSLTIGVSPVLYRIFGKIFGAGSLEMNVSLFNKYHCLVYGRHYQSLWLIWCLQEMLEEHV